MINVLAFGLALLLSATNFFSEAYGRKIEKYHTRLISFSAGLFITFIFLRLMPEFFEGVKHAGNSIFLLMLLGFVFFHIIEKYVYQHVTNKKELMKDLAEVHAAGFFLDHFVVGIALFLAFSVPDYRFGMLIFIPLFMHVLVFAEILV